MKKLIEKIECRGDFGKVISCEPLAGGIINQTFKVKTESGSFVFQKIHSILGKESLNDYRQLQDQLGKGGIMIPQLIGTLEYDSGKELWRIMEYIKHQSDIRLNDDTAAVAARHLGIIHQGLRGCGFTPRASIPGFHDSSAIFAKLQTYIDIGNNKEVAESIRYVAEKSRKMRPLQGPTQHIHGDPKFQNFLFDKKGRFVTLIDWETLMIGHVLIDVGDMMRSFCKKSDNAFDLRRFAIMCDQYRYFAASPYYSNEEILAATKLITLELATRFLIDWFEDSYFRCRPEFASRKESNLASAQKYVSYFKTIP